MGQRTDEVPEAVNALLVALRESLERNRVSTRRAQTVRRLRSHGRSYREILHRVEGSLHLGITDESINRLQTANRGLHAAEARALRDEGLGLDEIAVLLGSTRRCVSDLLGPATQPGGAPSA